MAESKKRKTARERLTSLLGDFPQGFNAGMLAGIPGWAGDIGYLLQEYPRALLTDTPLRPPVEYAGTTDSIAKAAGYEIPGTLSGQLGAAVGGLLSPGPGDLAKFAPLLAGVMPVADDAGRAAGLLSAPADARLETARKNAVSMLGLPENNTAMDRARAMGFDVDHVVYHGSAEPFGQFDDFQLGSNTNADDARIGHHFAGSYADADLYAQLAASKKRNSFADDADAAGYVGEYLTRSEKPMVVDIDGPIYPEEKLDAYRQAIAGGYDSMVLPQGSYVDSDYTRIIFDPAKIRSRFAAFDPARIKDRDLLASLAALGILTTGGMLSAKDKDKKEFK